MESLRDLSVCLASLGSLAMTALYDLPGVPVYRAFAFLFHPVIGWLSVGCAFPLFLWTLAMAE